MSRAAFALLTLLLAGQVNCLRFEAALCESDDACSAGQLCAPTGFCVASDPRCDLGDGKCGATCVACQGRCQFIGTPERLVESQCIDGQIQLTCAADYLTLGGACRPKPVFQEIADDAVGGADAFWALAAKDGALWVASLDQAHLGTWDGASGVTVRRRLPGASTWSTEATVRRPSTRLDHPVLVEDGAGLMHLLVSQNLDPGNVAGRSWDLLHVYQEGGTWREGQVPGPTSRGGSWPNIIHFEAITFQEKVFAVIGFGAASNGSSRFLAARYSGTRWILDEQAPSLVISDPLRLRIDPESGLPRLFLPASLDPGDLPQLHIWGYSGEGWSDLAPTLPQPVISISLVNGVASLGTQNVACVRRYLSSHQQRKLVIWPGPTPIEHDLGLPDGNNFYPPSACEPFPSPATRQVLVAYVGDQMTNPPLRLEGIGSEGIPPTSEILLDSVSANVGSNPIRAFEVEGTLHLFLHEGFYFRGGALRHLQIDP